MKNNEIYISKYSTIYIGFRYKDSVQIYTDASLTGKTGAIFITKYNINIQKEHQINFQCFQQK